MIPDEGQAGLDGYTFTAMIMLAHPGCLSRRLAGS